MTASVALLAIDWTGQFLAGVWSRLGPFLPWLASLIALGLALGATLVAMSFIIAKYGQILTVSVSWAEVAAVWGLAALFSAIGSLAWLMLRVTGHLSMNLTGAIQDTATQVARLASASESRRPRGKPVAPRPSEPGGGEFVPYSDEAAFLNEQASSLRSQGITEDMIAETLRQAGRTINDNPEGAIPLG